MQKERGLAACQYRDLTKSRAPGADNCSRGTALSILPLEQRKSGINYRDSVTGKKRDPKKVLKEGGPGSFEPGEYEKEKE